MFGELGFRPDPEILRSYSWLCTHELLLLENDIKKARGEACSFCRKHMTKISKSIQKMKFEYFVNMLLYRRKLIYQLSMLCIQPSQLNELILAVGLGTCGDAVRILQHYGSNQELQHIKHNLFGNFSAIKWMHS